MPRRLFIRFYQWVGWLIRLWRFWEWVVGWLWARLNTVVRRECSIRGSWYACVAFSWPWTGYGTFIFTPLSIYAHYQSSPVSVNRLVRNLTPLSWAASLLLIWESWSAYHFHRRMIWSRLRSLRLITCPNRWRWSFLPLLAGMWERSILGFTLS